VEMWGVFLGEPAHSSQNQFATDFGDESTLKTCIHSPRFIELIRTGVIIS
jgi:hypothetical protein